MMLLAVPLLNAGTHTLTLRPVVSDMRIPWELHYGPDGHLWVTERPGFVNRIDPETGERTVILDHRSAMIARGEGGMMGRALHPQFPDSPFVFLAMTYGETQAEYRAFERWRYDAEQQKLVDQTEIYRIAPSAFGHQGGRMAFGPDGMLYITSGDNHGDGWVAQDPNVPLGKLLRLRPDGSVPDDNPIPGNPLWTLGHRNPQGIAFLPDGTIFTSEHGNTIEDEVNLIVKGGNYGWPAVEGPCDEDYEQDFCDSVSPLPPFFSSGPMDTEAFSDMAFYDHERFPQLRNSILLTTLKRSTIFQLHLNDSRTAVDSVTQLFRYAVGRIRDVSVTPDGRIFICTSNRDPNYYHPFPLEDDDHIYEIVALDPGDTAHIVGPDTVYVQGYAHETVYFSADVTNIGTAPTTITRIDRVITEGPLDHAHWTLPFVILPGMTYPVDLRFFPWDVDTHYGLVRLISDNSNNLDINLVGTSVAVSVREGDWSDDLEIYPQPFVNTVQITIPETIGTGTAHVLSVTGQLLWSSPVEGSKTVRWNGADADGQPVPAGTYLLVISDGSTTLRSLIRRSQP